MTDQELKNAVERVEEELNKQRTATINLKLDSHHDGPGIKAQESGGTVTGGMYALFEMAHEQGYVVTNVKDLGMHTKMFLREADDRLDPEVEIDVDAPILFKSLLDFNGEDDDSKHVINRHDTKVTLDFSREIDFEDPTIRRRLDRAGAFERPTAEGFLAGLLVGSTVVIEETMFGDILEEL